MVKMHRKMIEERPSRIAAFDRGRREMTAAGR